MKVPFLDDSVIARISPHAVKLLMYFCAHRGSDSWTCGTVSNESRRIDISERRWRLAVAELREAGLVEYRVTCDGFRARPMIGTRFTWVPSFRDERLNRASARACKVLLAVCRAAHNATRSVKMRLDTIARRIGKCVRTVQLALSELATRAIVDGHRTGRSNWFCIRKVDEEESLFTQPEIAHRAGLLLRLLSSSTPECLTRILSHRRSEKGTRETVRSGWISVGEFDPVRRTAHAELRRLGVRPDNAKVLALAYHPSEVFAAVEMATGRRLDRPTEWFTSRLKAGTVFA